MTPEKKSRSRPPSYAGGGGGGGGDSPLTLRSRSSTCDSLHAPHLPPASNTLPRKPIMCKYNSLLYSLSKQYYIHIYNIFTEKKLPGSELGISTTCHNACCSKFALDERYPSLFCKQSFKPKLNRYLMVSGKLLY